MAYKHLTFIQRCRIRKYLKKGSDFASITDADLMVIADKLNNRPRKTLDFATPNEIFIRMAHEQI